VRGRADFGYTFQRSLTDTGLMDYKARMYDPTIGRFVQPDTLVPSPSSSQALNRYAYVNNNPVKYTDPSGHRFTDVMDPVERKIITQKYRTTAVAISAPSSGSQNSTTSQGTQAVNGDNGIEKELKDNNGNSDNESNKRDDVCAIEEPFTFLYKSVDTLSTNLMGIYLSYYSFTAPPYSLIILIVAIPMDYLAIYEDKLYYQELTKPCDELDTKMLWPLNK
jgi:RHS repeat-associated protein